MGLKLAETIRLVLGVVSWLGFAFGYYVPTIFGKTHAPILPGLILTTLGLVFLLWEFLAPGDERPQWWLSRLGLGSGVSLVVIVLVWFIFVLLDDQHREGRHEAMLFLLVGGVASLVFGLIRLNIAHWHLLFRLGLASLIIAIGIQCYFLAFRNGDYDFLGALEPTMEYIVVLGSAATFAFFGPLPPNFPWNRDGDSKALHVMVGIGLVPLLLLQFLHLWDHLAR